MSRWIENFESHAFRTTWEDLKIKLEESEADGNVPTALQELARLVKVVAFLDNALDNIDPELFPESLLDSFNQQATQARDKINTFNANRSIAHIKSANTNVDNLLTYVRPYMIVEGSMKKTLLSSVRAYNTEMEKSIEKFNESALEKLEEIQASKSKIDTYEADTKSEFEAAEEARSRIDEYESKLLGSVEDETSIKDKIEEIEESFTQKHEQLQGLYNETFVDDEETSIKTALETAKEELESDASEARGSLKNLRSEIKQFDDFYENIFGTLNEEDDVRENGLKQELDDRLEQLEQYEKTQNTKYTALLEKIEALLPGATSAGLASAYKELKDSFTKPINHWNWLFIGSVTIMFLATFLSFTHIELTEAGKYIFSFANADSLDKTFNSLLHKLPLYAPLIWLAIFASKRRSEMQRLQQEYAHKEALAKSYDSYKTQIEQLEKGDQEMLLKLIENSINTIAHNASETLDGKHGDGTPLQEFMKNAGEIKKIFGDGK